MKIKNFEQFVKESTVNELSTATIDTAHSKRSNQMLDRGRAGENVEKEYNKMAALYKSARSREMYMTDSAVGKITSPAVKKGQEYGAKLDALVKDKDVYATVIFGDKRKGPITKKILVMYGGNEVVLGEVNSGNSNMGGEHGSRNIIVRLDGSSTIFVPDALLKSFRDVIQPILDLAAWKLEIETKLSKFAHTEGSQTISPDLLQELPAMDGYKATVNVEERVKPISEWGR